MKHRWRGCTLTNWKTVSLSHQRLQQDDEAMSDGAEGPNKKERLGMERDQAHRVRWRSRRARNPPSRRQDRSAPAP